MNDLNKIKCLLAHPTAASVREAVLVERMIRMGRKLRNKGKPVAKPVSNGYRAARPKSELLMPSTN